MQTKNNISSLELFSMLFISSLYSAMMYSVHTVTVISPLAHPVSMVIAAVIVLLLIIPLKFFLKKSGKENIIVFSQTHTPKLAPLYSALYLIYFIYTSVFSLVIFSFLLQNFINPELAYWQFFLFAALCCGYAGMKGISAVSRTSCVLLAIIVLFLLFIVGSLSAMINPLNLSDYALESLDYLPENVIHAIGQASCLPSLYIFSKKLNNKLSSSLRRWVLVSYTVYIVLSIISFGVLGIFAKETPFPLYASTQLIELGSFKRLDIIFLFLWTVGMFINVSLSMYSINETANNTFTAVKARIAYYICSAAIFVLSILCAYFTAVKNTLINTKVLLLFFLAVSLFAPIFVILGVRKQKKHKRKNTAAIYITAVCAAVLLSGCSKTQIQDRLIIKGIGIDSENGGYTLTLQYIDTAAAEVSPAVHTTQVYGDTVSDAIGNIKNSTGKEPFIGQNTAVVLGRQTARTNTDNALDYFLRYNDARPNVRLYISETTANEVLSFRKDGEIIPIESISFLSPESSLKGHHYTLLDFVNLRKDSTQTAIACTLQADNDKIFMPTVTAFTRDGLYTLDKNDYLTYKLLTDKAVDTVLSFEDISCRITAENNRIIAAIKDEKPVFYAECKFKMKILENPNSKDIAYSERLFSSQLEELMTASTKKMLKEKQSDIYGFSKRLSVSDRRKYTDEDLYCNMLSNSTIIIKAECIVK